MPHFYAVDGDPTSAEAAQLRAMRRETERFLASYQGAMQPPPNPEPDEAEAKRARAKLPPLTWSEVSTVHTKRHGFVTSFKLRRALGVFTANQDRQPGRVRFRGGRCVSGLKSHPLVLTQINAAPRWVSRTRFWTVCEGIRDTTGQRLCMYAFIGPDREGYILAWVDHRNRTEPTILDTFTDVRDACQAMTAVEDRRYRKSDRRTTGQKRRRKRKRNRRRSR